MSVQKCERFIYREVLKGPVSYYDLLNRYFEKHMTELSYTSKDMQAESANFARALIKLKTERRVIIEEGTIRATS